MQFNIRVEHRTHAGAQHYDFAQPAFTREAALMGAEDRIRHEHDATAKLRWRGLVAFVDQRPAEEIAS